MASAASAERAIEPTLVVARESTTELLEPGTAVGEYLVDERIGEGGFGAVYAASHPVIGKRAAVKILSREFSTDASLSARFINEARAVNTIRHHNIVDIFSFGRLKDQRLYLIMEMLEGESLETYLRRKKKLDVAETITVFHAIARALDATHAAGIVHRDLKPANVYLAIDGEGTVTPKLLDFGIAKLDASKNYVSYAPTEHGAVLGTPAYMAPEQCRGETVDFRADVYSFGVMLFRALTGRVPFEGKNVLSVAVAQTVSPPPNMSELASELPAELDAPILHMLAKDPNDRPASVGAALAELVEAAGMSVPRSLHPADLVAQAAAPESRVRRLAHTARGWTRTGSLLIAAALVGAVAVGWFASRHEAASAKPEPAVEATPVPPPAPSAAPEQHAAEPMHAAPSTAAATTPAHRARKPARDAHLGLPSDLDRPTF